MKNNKRNPTNCLFRLFRSCSRPVLIITLALAGFGCTLNAQTENTNTGEGTRVEDEYTGTVKKGGGEYTAVQPEGYNGPFQGKVVSKGPIEFVKSDDLAASLKDASLGKVFLKYVPDGEGSEMEIELPEQAMDVLNEFFRYRLKYTVERIDRPAKNANEGYQRDRGLMDAVQRADGKLFEIEIDAPDGRRKLSSSEVSDLTSFVTGAAIELVEGYVK